MSPLTEHVQHLGPGGRIVGIVTVPEVQQRRACVIVTAGLVPKFGPFRLYAQLARRLAREGYVSIRFDLGGIGDSGASSSGQPVAERTSAEIAAAVEHLTGRYELDTLVVGGLCSGAEDSFRYAARDPRVTGVVMLDPFAYRTSSWHPRHLAYRAMRRSLRALGVYQPLPIETGNRLVNYKYMEHGESSQILKALIDRHARVHFIYTGGMHDTFNHPAQLAAMFQGVDFRGLVTLDHFPHTDHTQLFQDDRDRLLDAIGERLASW